MNQNQPFQARQISDRVHWVGAIDWALPEFHGYRTERGTTYNAFLVMADKITLIDTVKKPFLEEAMSRIASVVDPQKIDYIVSNHSEMDHSGCLPEMAARIQPEQIFASPNGVRALSAHFHRELSLTAVKTGDRLDLGNASLQFVETRMIHWPDSMVSFLDSDGILFSQDAFGMHLATSRLFADQNERSVLQWQAEKYYANIVLPYSPMVGRALAAIEEMNLPLQILAPDHGPLWRGSEDIAWIFEQYRRFVAQRPTAKVVIAYDTMWHSSEAMANAIAEGVERAGAEPRVLSLHSTHRSDLATEVMNSGGLVIGSPTLNSSIFPSLADALTYLKGLNPRNLTGALFGSYGWNRKGMGELQEFAGKLDLQLVDEPLFVNYVPTDADLCQCVGLGEKVGREVVRRHAE